MLVTSSGIDQIGTIQWHLVVALMGAWILVFLCLIKGVKSVGKVSLWLNSLVARGLLKLSSGSEVIKNAC